MKTNLILAAAAAVVLAAPAFAQDSAPSEDVLAKDLESAVAAEFPGGAAFDDNVRQAFAHAMGDVSSGLRSSGIPENARVGILPISGDRGNVVRGLLKNAVVKAGHVCVEDGSDPIWKAILAEADFDIRNAGLLDEKTLVRIGDLQTVDVVLYGAVRASAKEENRVFVELELHATDRASKKHVWGDLFAKRWYVPGAEVPKGISELPTALREQLKNAATDKFVASVQAQPKLAKVRTVALVPLAGDDDRYCTYIVRDGLTRLPNLTAKELDLQSLQGGRQIFRDLPVVAGDAVIYGAVRQLGWYQTEGFLGIFDHYDVQIDFQAAIERNDTHDVLWSDTIQSFEEFYVWNWVRIILLGVGALVALVVLLSLIKAATRVR